MHLQTNAVARLMRGFEPKVAPTPKLRGRPRKLSEELFRDVLRGHRAISEWFAEKHGRPARSDVELFEHFRAYVLSVSHVEGRAAHALSIGYSMKTVQNVLGQARRFYREHPEKCPFLGVDAEREAKFNQSSESEIR